jgi:hypothetical protein
VAFEDSIHGGSGDHEQLGQCRDVLDRLKAEVRAAQMQAQRAVNAELLDLFWVIGSEILQRAETAQDLVRAIRKLGERTGTISLRQINTDPEHLPTLLKPGQQPALH